MSIYKIFDKTTGKVVENGATTNPVVVELNVEQEQIKSIAKTGDDLTINLESGEQVTVKDYYSGSNANQMVVKNAEGQYFELNLDGLNAEGLFTEVNYSPIENFTDYLYKDASIFSNMAVIGGGIAAGLAGIAVAVS